MAPIPAPSSYSPSLQTTRLHTLAALFLHIRTSLTRRDLGPNQGQSVGMAIGLSIAGVFVFIFLFGWIRYLAAKEHQREAERRKGKKEAQEKPAEGGGEEAPPVEEAAAE